MTMRGYGSASVWILRTQASQFTDGCKVQCSRWRVVMGYKKNAKRARTDVMGEDDARRR